MAHSGISVAMAPWANNVQHRCWPSVGHGFGPKIWVQNHVISCDHLFCTPIEIGPNLVQKWSKMGQFWGVQTASSPQKHYFSTQNWVENSGFWALWPEGSKGPIFRISHPQHPNTQHTAQNGGVLAPKMTYFGTHLGGVESGAAMVLQSCTTKSHIESMFCMVQFGSILGPFWVPDRIPV